MPGESRSQVWGGRTRTGYLIRVEGHGTMRESHAIQRFAAGALTDDTMTLSIDLNNAQFLDSTFLGCLVRLHKQFGQRQPGSFRIFATSEKVKTLLMPSRLHTVFTITDEADEVLGGCVAITSGVLDPKDLGHHIMDCHRQLAEIEGPDQDAFRRIADQLDAELNK
jgi:anti-anti-sigma factor